MEHFDILSSEKDRIDYGPGMCPVCGKRFAARVNNEASRAHEFKHPSKSGTTWCKKPF